LHLKAANQRGIDELIERNGLAELGLERFRESLALRVGQRRCRSDISRHFTTSSSSQITEHSNDLVQRKQATVASNETQEVANQWIDPGLTQDRIEGRSLHFCRDDGRMEIAREIIAFPDQ